MTSAQESEAGPDTDTGKDKSDKKKTKVKAEKDQAKETKETTEEPKKTIKKKQAIAKEIDITQAKRKVRRTPKPVKKRKTVRAVKIAKPARNIGVEVIPPEESCDDPDCPFHGTLSVRGQILTGIVVTAKMDKTAIVQREILRVIPKYERFEKRTHNYAVHNPPCMDVKRGDLVRIMECRPLSKSKSFVVIEKT